MPDKESKKSVESKVEVFSENKPLPHNTPTPMSKQSTFSLEHLRRDCRKLFGISQSTFDAVVYKLDGKYTIEKRQEMIKAWQNKPVILMFRKERE